VIFSTIFLHDRASTSEHNYVVFYLYASLLSL